jgi:hypothetical protein
MGKLPINGLESRGFDLEDGEENIFGQGFKLGLWQSCEFLENKGFRGFKDDIDKIEGCNCHGTGVNRPELRV